MKTLFLGGKKGFPRLNDGGNYGRWDPSLSCCCSNDDRSGTDTILPTPNWFLSPVLQSPISNFIFFPENLTPIRCFAMHICIFLSRYHSGYLGSRWRERKRGTNLDSKYWRKGSRNHTTRYPQPILSPSPPHIEESGTGNLGTATWRSKEKKVQEWAPKAKGSQHHAFSTRKSSTPDQASSRNWQWYWLK